VGAEVSIGLHMAKGPAAWPRSIGLRSSTCYEWHEALGKQSRGPLIWALIGWSLSLAEATPH